MSDLFFIASKVFWFIAAPDHLLLLMLLLGCLCWRSALGKLLAGTSTLLFLILMLYPLGNLLIAPLEQRYPQAPLPEQLAGIIVLGGGEKAEETLLHNSPSFGEAAERVMVIPQLLQKYPDAKVIFTGGSGSVLKPEFRGGDVVQRWLQAQGLAERVVIERDSRNTFENAVFSKAVLSAEELSGRWLLVTSAFHMPRSMGIFTKQGWNVQPYAVDYHQVNNALNPVLHENMRVLRTAVREWIGLVAYYLTDKTDQLLPGPAE